MVTHTQTIRQQERTNCLSVFDNFVVLAQYSIPAQRHQLHQSHYTKKNPGPNIFFHHLEIPLKCYKGTNDTFTFFFYKALQNSIQNNEITLTFLTGQRKYLGKNGLKFRKRYQNDQINVTLVSLLFPVKKFRKLSGYL